ncbi:MAG: RNA methyltransferase [Clostridia bacterium]|nr:RNA methyltransferase [Clostridia bacterium]
MIIQREVITARQNPTVKRLASLADKKGRWESGLFIAEGLKLTLEAAGASLPVVELVVCESRRDELMPMLLSAFSSAEYENTRVYFVSSGVFEKISTEKAPQGVICVIKHLDFFKKMDIIYKEDFFLSAGERAIFLCSVRDPSNLGSVIRSSVAFGVEHIVLSSDCADFYNPKVVRSAMGSLFRVKITAVSDTTAFVNAARECGRRVFAAELTDSARSVGEVGLSPEDIVIIGNEGHGIPAEVSRATDGSIYIPISERTESLNASVAAAIFMWEQGKKQ